MYTMESNVSMKKLLVKFNILERIDVVELDPDLELLLINGIVEINGCYFLDKFIPSGFDFNKDEILKRYMDLTGYECSINDIPIPNRYYPPEEDWSVEKRLRQVIRYGLDIIKILPKNIPFKIILGVSFEPLIGCQIRFHKIRSGENWLLEDLEKYEDPIMVLCTS